MFTSFDILSQAQTIVFMSPLLTLAAAVCDMLEKAGIPAALSHENGSPIVVVPPSYAVETSQYLKLAWAGLH